MVLTLRPETELTDRLASPLPLPHRGKKEEKILTLSGRRRVRTPTSKDAASVNRDVERFDSAKAERIKAADQKTMTMPMAASRPPAPLISLHASKKRFSLFEMERSNLFSISSSLYLPLPTLSILLDVFQPLPTSQLLLPPKALAPSSLLIYLLLLTLNLLVDVVVAVVDNASLFHFSSSRFCQETDIFLAFSCSKSAKNSFSAMTRRRNRSRPAHVPADSSQDPEQSGDRDESAVGQQGLGGGGAVDEAAGPPASPAAASSGRQDGEEMDDSGFEEPPRKLWRGERPGEQEDFVYIYQRCRMDDPSVSPRMRHQTAQNEMHPEATNRAAEAAAGPDCRRSGVDPDYEGPEEFEWEGANKRLGGSGLVNVLDITRSRRMQELRAARGAKPVWRRPRSRKSADAPTQEAAGRPAPPPKKKKASRGASATAAAAQRQPASSKRPPMPPPPRTSFSVRRIARPEGESPPPIGRSSTDSSDAADHVASADVSGGFDGAAAEGRRRLWTNASAAPRVQIRTNPHRTCAQSSTAATAAAEGAAAEIVIIGSAPADAAATPTPQSPGASVPATPSSRSAPPKAESGPRSRTGRPRAKGPTLGPSGSGRPHEDKTGDNKDDENDDDSDEHHDPKPSDGRKHDNVRVGAARGQRRGRQRPRRAPQHSRRKTASRFGAAKRTATADARPRRRKRKRSEGKRSERRSEAGLEEGAGGVERGTSTGVPRSCGATKAGGELSRSDHQRTPPQARRNQ